MYAAAFGHREIVLLILAAFRQLHHVAFQGQRNGQGLTAWQLAEKNGHEDIAAILKVESGVFPRPSGPSAFVPANPLDLDRPPTPTESRKTRSSARRSKSLGRNTGPASGPGPTDPLPPPAFITFCTDCQKTIPPRHQHTGTGAGEGAHRRKSARNFCTCSEDQNSEEEENTAWEDRDFGIRRNVPSSTWKLTLGTSGNPNIKSVIGLTGGSNTNGATGHSSSHTVKGAVLVSSSFTSKGATGYNSSHNVKSPVLLSRSKGAIGVSGSHINRSVTRANSVLALKDAGEAATDDDSDNNAKDLNVERLRARSSWTRDIGNGERSRRRAEGVGEEEEADKRSQVRSEPLRVGAPDAEERKVLQELMHGLSISGSPGSGNEADTESLMECEHQPPASEGEDKPFVRMTTNNARKITVTGATLAAAQPMPKIELSSSSRSLNRSIQHLVQEDAENHPEHRPPTPARPSLPTLLPGRFLDVSFSASISSTKSEGRNVPPVRKANLMTFPRSSSEPRSLTQSPKPSDDDAEDDTSTDFLESSVRSEGWDLVRGAKGRGPSFSSSEGHVVPLPPINRPRYSDVTSRGRGNVRGRGHVAGCEENVLSVAKKTLEQLETVLAPKETAALPRTIPRTRTHHQIHLET
ncbi:uncharacterized protein [Procambarus clarkii]|nr:uncharacterized protein LOC123746822 isoform X2 [Procambarus clarkii]XP_045584557.1 uncharacterized protein LOC123746822 isoform X2 [Procambarus clarkii]